MRKFCKEVLLRGSSAKKSGYEEALQRSLGARKFCKELKKVWVVIVSFLGCHANPKKTAAKEARMVNNKHTCDMTT